MFEGDQLQDLGFHGQPSVHHWAHRNPAEFPPISLLVIATDVYLAEQDRGVDLVGPLYVEVTRPNLALPIFHGNKLFLRLDNHDEVEVAGGFFHGNRVGDESFNGEFS